MLVRERMSAPAVLVAPETSFHAALVIVRDLGVRHLPVVQTDGALVGMVTERDLLLAAMHYTQAEVALEDLMSREVVTTTPDTPLAEAATLMATNRIGGLPVLEERRVVGMITETDLLFTFAEL